jgi:site-specific DNA-methyltransferase (adenine-specific)
MSGNFNCRRTVRIIVADQKVIGKKKCSRKGIAVAEERSVRAAGSYGEAKEVDVVEPCSKEAQRWQGWKSALKPSNEPIVLARKPLNEKSIACNILHYGTGCINIDACQVGESGGTQAVVKSRDNTSRRIHKGGISNDVDIISLGHGRFPSNTIIDEEVAELLKDKAKFFYTAKVSQKERNAGCEHLEAKAQNCEGKKRTFNDRCAVCGKKFIGSPNTICQCPPGVKKTDKTVYKNKNNHPTVKPISLMEYLVKLVTPKNGICLDLFMGSGSTGIACALNDFHFIGIEREFDYFEIAKARIAYWTEQKIVA